MNGLGRRFLSYIVEKALAGRADRIKAFSIATDVLGRVRPSTVQAILW